MPVVHRRAPDRGLIDAHLTARDRAEGDRRVRRPKGRGPDRGDPGAQGRGEHREPVHVAGPALVGAHAQRGVALEVLDRGVPFPHRELDVGHRHVVLEIDEALAVPPGRQRHRPERPHRSAVLPLLDGRTGGLRPRLEACGAGCIGAGRDPVGKAFGQADEPARGARRAFAPAAVTPAALARRTLLRHERRAFLVEPQPAL